MAGSGSASGGINGEDFVVFVDGHDDVLWVHGQDADQANDLGWGMLQKPSFRACDQLDRLRAWAVEYMACALNGYD